MRTMINAHKVLVGKLQRKIRFERPRRRVEDTIEMDLQEVGCEGVDLGFWLRARASGGPVSTIMNQ
jgi:hypothetical protein